jgi:uncharacterized protein
MQLAGLVLVSFITFSPALAAGPSFDCGKAEGEVETMVCRDPQLTALDRETARLFRLAAQGRHMNAARLQELKDAERAFLSARDARRTDDDRRFCVMAAYAARIAGLRQGYFRCTPAG